MPELVRIEPNPEVYARLEELPTATTFNERLMALHFAHKFWDGESDVFENGPLLGGATRALALGMLANEASSPSARLRTYDWWSASVPLDLPEHAFDLLLQEGRIGHLAYAAATRGDSFRRAFRDLHEGQDYGPLIVDEVGYLPGRPGEEAPDGAMTFSLEGYDGRFSLLFVDGCKSWYGTKHWALETLDRATVGAHVLFQDFGQYTCFWIPMLVGLLSDHLRLRAHVDHTYAFEVARPIDRADVDRLYPDEPEDLEPDRYEGVLGRLAADALERGDVFATMSLGAQLAAALAYTGHEEDARRVLDRQLARLDFLPWRDYLKRARYSPTYRPDGSPVLL